MYGIKPDQCEALKLQHASFLMSFICILMKNSTYLVGITSKDNVIYLVNNAYTNWRAKTGKSDNLVHISLPTVYPQFNELYLNLATFKNLTDEFDNRFVPLLSCVVSTDLDLSSLVSTIKDSVDMFRNNNTVAPIDAHSSCITFDHTSLPFGVMDCYLAQ